MQFRVKSWIVVLFELSLAMTKKHNECQKYSIHHQDRVVRIHESHLENYDCIDFEWNPSNGRSLGNDSFSLISMDFHFVYTVVEMKHSIAAEKDYPFSMTNCLRRKNKVTVWRPDLGYDTSCISGNYLAFCDTTSDSSWSCSPDPPSAPNVVWSGYMDKMRTYLNVTLENASYLHLRLVIGCHSTAQCTNYEGSFFSCGNLDNVDHDVFINEHFVCDNIPNCPSNLAGNVADESSKICPNYNYTIHEVLWPILGCFLIITVCPVGLVMLLKRKGRSPNTSQLQRSTPIVEAEDHPPPFPDESQSDLPRQSRKIMQSPPSYNTAMNNEECQEYPKSLGSTNL